MITAKFKRPRGRQDIWEAIRHMSAEDVSLTDAKVAAVAQCRGTDVRMYLRGLVKAGFLAVLPGNTPKTYALVRDNGREAPRVRRDGTICPPTRRESMWRTMGRLKAFSCTTLAVAASTEEVPVSEADARDYLKNLYRAGYLAVVKAAAPPAKGRTMYRLVRRTGGIPPQVLRTRAVYDPNTREIEWLNTQGIEA